MSYIRISRQHFAGKRLEVQDEFFLVVAQLGGGVGLGMCRNHFIPAFFSGFISAWHQ